ncbi:MRG-domain-containing protein [Blyttiomyces helicus]|uniref:Chromatin modification-related protein EAF3 n=1 Tax=Blyttiomyces helicus TaxID=388810 RepID=A0A4P9VV63_9FUNG|nr:MRG-domain-containing protein [Blyttiomyces helicus]|eukprot:RKO83514.1 MRG-domain-containing protein [Blyttiomyces helicus]
MAAAARTLAFAENELILCFHGPLLYEAKVLECDYWEVEENGEEGPHYLVHYQGWKAKWDEWVPESRVMKLTDENRRRQDDLAKSVVAKKAKTGKGKAVGTAVANGGEGSGEKRGTKRGRESTVDEKEELFLRRPEVKIPVPDFLKSQLVVDWETVTKHQKILSLPRKDNVMAVLNQFRLSVGPGNRKKATARDKDLCDETMEEIIHGLSIYFDKALGSILLYRFERQQYVEIKRKMPDTKMSDIEGQGCRHRSCEWRGGVG